MAVIVPGALGQFADLVNESIQDIFVKRADFPTQMQSYFNVKDTNSYYTKDSSVTGVDSAHKKMLWEQALMLG